MNLKIVELFMKMAVARGIEKAKEKAASAAPLTVKRVNDYKHHSPIFITQRSDNMANLIRVKVFPVGEKLTGKQWKMTGGVSKPCRRLD